MVVSPMSSRALRRLKYRLFLLLFFALILWLLYASFLVSCNIRDLSATKLHILNVRTEGKNVNLLSKVHLETETQNDAIATPLISAERNSQKDKVEVLPNISKSDATPFRLFLNASGAVEACLIPNACMVLNLDRWALFIPKQFRSVYEKHCDHQKVSWWPMRDYYDENNPPAELVRGLREKFDFDLLGGQLNTIAYRHFADSAPAFVDNAMVPASVFLDHQPSKTLCLLSPCNNSNSFDLMPRIGLSTNVINETLWSRAFYKMMTKNFKYLHIIPEQEHYLQPDPTCYRSIIRSTQIYDAKNKLHDRLFREHGVKREREENGLNSTCNPHIVVLERDPKVGLKRTMLPGTTDKLQQRFPKMEIVRDLGSLTFEEQIQVFQRTDILVTVHGAELTNSVFFRERTHVLEIMPFGYYYPWFDGIFDSAHVNLTRIYAPPDEEQFYPCAKVYGPLAQNKTAQQMVFQDYEARVKLYKNANNDSARDNAANWISKNYDSLFCIRLQRLVANASWLELRIQHQIDGFCNTVT